MKKIALSLIALSLLSSAGEFQYGSGTFNMTGGFMGLTGTIGTDVDTFAYVERHSNIAGSDVFYSYDFTWFDSNKMKQAQHTYNDITSNMNSVSSRFLPETVSTYAQIPEMDYRLKGLDINMRLGYDVVHQDQDNFLGLGVLVGLSVPWIDSSKSDSAAPSFGFITDNSGELLDAADYFEDSETTLMTYKIGPTVNFQKTLIDNKVSLYGIGSIAYQTGYIENDKISSKFSVDGSFQEYNIGLYFTPFTETYKWGWLSLSPRIYATLGYKYSKWDVDKVTINMSGAELSSDILDPLGMEFGMDTSISYFGVGYSF